MSGYQPQHQYRLQKDSEDLRDHIFTKHGFKTVAHIPASWDLRAQLSPILDQGQLGCCSGFAISGLREYWTNLDKSPEALSQLYLYYYERALEGTVDQDSGAMLRDGMKVLQQRGTCPAVDWPYNIQQFTTKPPLPADTEAAPYRIKEYHRITDLTMMKTAVASGYPVVIGMDVYDSFESDAVASTGIMPMPNTQTEQCLGGHAVLVVGYTDAKQWMVVRNSWGATWGDKGYFYLPYSYWTSGHISDAWSGR